MRQKLSDTDKRLVCMAFVNRENNKRHHYYDEEMKQYVLMANGDMSAVEESVRMMTSGLNGHLSDDPVKNVKYLLIANITIATRFSIQGGLDSETAYNISDLYIREADACETVEDVLEVHRAMFTYFTKRMAGLKKETVFSRPVIQCLDYIDMHLHRPVRVSELAEYVNLSPSYLSVLFKKEMGIPISDYIMQRRIDTAKNMLQYSEYPVSQISEILAFSSQSHFIRCFKRLVNMTPNEYQKSCYQEAIFSASKIPQDVPV